MQYIHDVKMFACMYTVVRDVVVEEMHRGSSVIVMATAQSISCLHAKLLPSRGNHLFRKTIEISSPNLVCIIYVTKCTFSKTIGTLEYCSGSKTLKF